MTRQSKVQRLLLVTRIIWKIGLAKMLRRDMPKAVLLQDVIELGGVYLKFLQILAVKNLDVIALGSEHIKSISEVYDRVALETIDIHAVIREELGANAGNLARIESEPFASGSFGQVYRAWLASGEELAIKVIRPSVIKNCNFDLRILGMIVRIANLSNKSAFDLRALFREFAKVTRGELDYVAEAKYAQLLYDKYQNHPYMTIPKTYTHLSSKHVITQEFIHGVSATELLHQKELGVDPAQYVQTILGSHMGFQLMVLGEEQLSSMLVDGYSHGDPHPGNIVLMTNNRVALLDFGIKSRSPSDRKAFFAVIKQYQQIYAGHFDIEEYTLAMMNLFVSELTGAVRALDTYTSGMATEQMLQAIKTAVGEIYQGSMQDVSELLLKQKYLLIFNSVINQGNRFGLRYEMDEPEFLRATNIYINLVDALANKQSILSNVYTNVVNRYSTMDFPARTKATSPEQAIEVISGWLDDIAARDIYLFNKLSSKVNIRLLGA